MEDHRKRINRVLLFMMGVTLVSGQLCKNCLNGCVEETRLCSGGCIVGWDGPTCSRQNVAFQQSATQSSQLSDYGPSLAVDGRTGHHFFSEPHTCTHTLEGLQQANWTLTLDAQYNIYRFRIYNRDEKSCEEQQCGARLNGFTLSVGNSSSQNYKICYQDATTGPEGPGPTVDGVCNGGPVLGEAVSIMISNSRPLSLCEVQVFVCTHGTYGVDCDQTCGNCAQGPSVCDTISGNCPQSTPWCMPGYSGVKCDTACTPGIYGADCLEKCGHCAGNQLSCDTVSGNCRNTTPRCMPGYSGPRCDKVCYGTYGADCAERCGHCAELLTPCDPTSGNCSERTPRCMPGYTGVKCNTECSPGTYGPDCGGSCGFCAERNATCNTTSGNCPDREPRCALGYSGLKCDTVSEPPDYTGVIIGCSVGIALVLIIGVIILVVVV